MTPLAALLHPSVSLRILAAAAIAAWLVFELRSIRRKA
jgi:hypothetical protein